MTKREMALREMVRRIRDLVPSEIDLGDLSALDAKDYAHRLMCVSDISYEALTLIGTPDEEEGWRDIASAPKDGTVIDLWAHGLTGMRRVADCSFGNGTWWCRADFDEVRHPTRWRPLPDPPGEPS